MTCVSSMGGQRRWPVFPVSRPLPALVLPLNILYEAAQGVVELLERFQREHNALPVRLIRKPQLDHSWFLARTGAGWRWFTQRDLVKGMLGEIDDVVGLRVHITPDMLRRKRHTRP